MLRNSLSYSIALALLLICGTTAFDAYGQTPSTVAQPSEADLTVSNETLTDAGLPSQVEPSTDIAGDLQKSAKLFDLGQYTEAKNLIRRVLLASPTQNEALELQRRLAIGSDDEALLIQALRGLTQADPSNAARWYSELEILGVVITDTPTNTQTSSSAPTSLGTRLRSGLGLIVFLLIAYLLSSDRHAIQRRLVLWGLGLQ
ncbi:MAG: Na+ dependent nucleoside transporter N-terminal domain-containing protein, partial [Myxococcota bacterium]|nr:Na+ dependent nucleoside transporter N-terminal domain-containing protein [Myxococcota bacterium]